MNSKIFSLKDEQATIELGRALALICSQQTTLYLHGDLGAGKTTFSRGFIRAWDIKVTSKAQPTHWLSHINSVCGRSIILIFIV